MDIHAIQGDQCTHVLTTHRTEADETPLQMVSAKQVKEWMRKEVDYDALMENLAGAAQGRGE